MTDSELLARLGEVLDRFDPMPAIDRLGEVGDRFDPMPAVGFDPLPAVGEGCDD